MKLVSLEAEISALAACLNPAHVKTAMTCLNADLFSSEAHQAIFSAMKSLHDAGTPIDVVTVAEMTGNRDVISQLEDLSFTGSNVKAYAEILEGCRLNRTIKTLGDYLASDSDDDANVRRERALSILQGAVKSEAHTVTVGKALKDLLPELEKRYENRLKGIGLRTGFRALDERLNGIRSTDLVIIAGRPSMGKTTFALNVAANAAEPGKSVVIFSLEVSTGAIAEKLLSIAGRISYPGIRSGSVFCGDHPDTLKIIPAIERLKTKGIWINDRAQTTAQMRAACYRVQATSPIKAIFIDYMQLMTSDEKAQSREQEVAKLSRSLKGLAKEFDCPVFVLSQLNRGLESRTDKRPQMADLRESGAIEQDADIILMLYRDEVYNAFDGNKGICEVITRKFRNGEIGTDHLRFVGCLSLFEDLPADFVPRVQEVKPQQTRKGMSFDDDKF